jgi:hypothetical protein
MAGAARQARSCTVVLLALGVILTVILLVVFFVLNAIPNREPLPGEERCVLTANDRSVAVDTEQAHYASVIAGVSVRRGLAPRAASIALATAYQESGIRNLDHGDRDSVGLFQQRPSQGWGSEKKLMDPFFATNAFYDALIKIEDWENGDITEIAQQIQISGYPDAYRDHESDARILASVYTGHSRDAIRCLIRDPRAGDPDGLAKLIRKTYKIKPKRTESVITIKADSADLAWAYGQFALGNADGHGVERVQIGDRQLVINSRRLPEWQAAAEPINKRAVKITLR